MKNQIIERFPGIACAWVNAAGEYAEEYFGFADIENKVVVDENTIFPACSISKFITALCVMKLHEQKLIDIDKPANLYLKQWKLRMSDGNESSATIRAILCHTAGILDGEDAFYGLRRGDSEITLIDILDGKTSYNNRPACSEKNPGTAFEYSDAGYCVLQLLVQEISQKPFEDFAKEMEDNDLQSFDDTIVNTLKGKKLVYQIEELSFYHFSRRLHGTENDVTGCNLKDLLLAKNIFSDFLMDHGIVFALNGESIDTIYKGQHVHWKKRINGDPYYMLSRLGSNGEIGDYCFNGLAFKDAILNNIYSRSLFYCPEIITQLSECLRCPSLEEDYSNNSDYYLYEYRVPINQVLFDAHDDYTIPQKQEYFICRIAERLHELITWEMLCN